MTENNLNSMKNIRNSSLLLAVIVPVALYLLSFAGLPMKLVLALDVVVFVVMVMLAAVLNSTMRNIDRRL